MTVVLVFLLFVGAILGAWTLLQPARLGFRRALSAAWVAAVGVLAASPFLYDGLVGTGEAHNYGLAVADAIAQFRAGEIPLVGQTEFAFNGRIHPLRSAPALFYAAGMLDFLTFRQLSPWQVQNLCLSLALFCTPWVAFVTLRRWLHLPEGWAAGVAGLIGLLPSLSINAHGLNLFMTVLAIPSVVVATAAVAALGRCQRPSLDWALAIALASAWWAHPPVASWTTLAVGPVRLWILLRGFSWRQVGSMIVPYAFAGLLVQFVFVSVFTSQAHVLRDASTVDMQQSYAREVMSVLSDRFPENLLPVSRDGGLGSDLQLGWTVLLAWGLVFFRARNEHLSSHERDTHGLAALVTMSVFLALICFPWPGIDRYFWAQLPGSLSAQTNVWPMQRLWAIAPIFAWFAAARALPLRASRTQQGLLIALFALASFWSLYQCLAFVDRGWRSQRTLAESVRALQPANLDITFTAYGMLNVPPDYSQGGVAPWALFRIRDEAGNLIDDNFRAAIRDNTLEQELPLEVTRTQQGTLTISQPLRLKPRTQYVLEFDWTGERHVGKLVLWGPNTYREHELPSSGGSMAFGLSPGQLPAVTLSNDSTEIEEVQIVFMGDDYLKSTESNPSLGVARLRPVNRASLPVQVESLFPLRLKVNTQTPAWVETPRRFIPGYGASIDGFPAVVKASPIGNVMVSVPAGASEILVAYEGSKLLDESLFIAISGWAVVGFLAWVKLAKPALFQRQKLEYLPALVIAIWAFVLGVQWLTPTSSPVRVPPGAGPLVIQFRTQPIQVGRTQVIASSGVVGAGHFVTVGFRADQHLQITWETWGQRVSSEWIHFERDRVQELVVDAPPFYAHETSIPLQRSPRDSEIRVDFNGKTVLHFTAYTFNIAASEIEIGVSNIGGGFAEHVFSGDLISVARLPILPLPTLNFGPWPLRFQTTLAPDAPRSSPLLDFGSGKGVLSLDRPTAQVAQLSWRDAASSPFTSPTWAWDAGSVLDWELRPQGDCWEVRIPSLGIVFPTPSGSRPPDILAAARIGGTNSFYPGVSSLATRVRTVPMAPQHPSDGPYRAVVHLRSDFSGQPQPLLALGHTGRADVLSVKTVGEGQVQFAVDHWGSVPFYSPPLPLDLKQPFSFSFSTGSLRRGGEAPAEAEDVVLEVNGHEVWRFPLLTYPFAPHQVFPGDNSLGASSAVRLLEGQILESSRAKPSESEAP